MFCTECGQENRNDRKFCTNCGKPLRDYTKPRENLLMPNDIEKAQQEVKSNNKFKLICNIIYIIMLLAAFTCFVLACIFKNIANTLIIVGLAIIIVGLIILFIKKIKTKYLKNNQTKKSN